MKNKGKPKNKNGTENNEKTGDVKKMKNSHLAIIISTSVLSAVLIIAVIAGFAMSGTNDPAPVENDTDKQSETEADKLEELTTSGVYINPNYSNRPQTAKPDNTEEEPTETETETEKAVEDSFVFVSNGNGTCTLMSVKDSADSCLIIPEKSPAGEVVTSIADRAFYGRGGITAIQISSTVSSIGEMVFGDCRDLVYISVQPQNKNFKDIGGVLYTADEGTLIAYPSGKEASSFAISDNVRKIAAMAFYECPALRTIEYSGSPVDWSGLEIGKFNYALYVVSINCTGKE